MSLTSMLPCLFGVLLVACAGAAESNDDLDATGGALETPRDSAPSTGGRLGNIEKELNASAPTDFTPITQHIPPAVEGEVRKASSLRHDAHVALYWIELPTAGTYYAIDSRDDTGQHLWMLDGGTFTKVAICKAPMMGNKPAATVKCSSGQL